MKIAAASFLFAVSLAAAAVSSQMFDKAAATRICVAAPGETLDDRGSRCMPASRGFAVEPTPEPRVFRMWDVTKQDQSVLGKIPAKSTTLQTDVSSQLRVRVSGEGKWPQPYVLHIRSTTEAGWKWTVPPGPASRAIDVRLPDGKYKVIIDAPGHKQRTFERELVPGVNDFGLVRLKPVPQIFGVVQARDSGEPLPALLTSGGVLFAKSDEKGNFFGEVKEVRPATLEVTSPGYAPRIVLVPEKTLADLGRIEMTRGATVRVRLDWLGQELPKPMTAQLLDRNERNAARRVIRSQSITAPEFTFDGIPAGLYIVLVKGSKPLQQTGSTIKLTEGEVADLVLKLENIRLTTELTLGDTALSGHRLEVLHRKSRWEASFTTGELGVTSPMELWQSGEFMVQVKGDRLTLPFIKVLEASSPEERWTIAIPSATISGKVFDARNGKGLAAAEVILQSEVEESSSVQKVITAADGSYSLTGIRQGRHQISASAPGFTKTTIDWITFSKSDAKTRKVVPIPLKSAITRRISVRDWSGQPGGGALVLLGGPQGVRDRYTTDGNGVVEISSAAVEDTGTYVIVLPQRESFAVQPLTSGTESDAIHVSIPPPVGSIRIRATDGALPLEGIRFELRAGGIVLPTEVLLRISRRIGRLPETDASGELLLSALPSGLYEFWPAERPGTSSSAPVRVNVTQGETFVEVILARQLRS